MRPYNRAAVFDYPHIMPERPDLEYVVPILTSKHSLEYCLSYADRAHENGFQALIVLGGDKRVGIPRCVEHAWQLRKLLRKRNHTIALGGWANPNDQPERQVDYLSAADFNAEFFLTQVVSHHDSKPVVRFLETAERRGLTLPGTLVRTRQRSGSSELPGRDGVARSPAPEMAQAASR